MTTPKHSPRWVFAEERAHVLADATFVALCGLTMPATVPVYRVAPSLDVCRACDRLALSTSRHPSSPTTTPTVSWNPDRSPV
ncbi:MAG TPA: hypothetical protein VGJ13_09620 [Pseudonocardiaceae bacterium]